jgi:FkbH-like protein
MYSGILGEDLIENLIVTEHHKQFQEKLIGVFNKGLLLNIVSKNNSTDTDELFNKSNIISIPKNYFTCLVSNWESKILGIEKILLQLNIDQESVVFLDDNPRELSEVASAFPRMFLIKALDTAELNQILNLQFISNGISSSITSKQRTRDLKANQQRQFEAERSEESLEVLVRIKTSIKTKIADSDREFERSEELFNKTNQFNFSNRRSRPLLSKEKGSEEVLISSVSDIYSDSGIISSMMYKKLQENKIEISEFVISCRALGRGIENYIFKSMLDILKVNNKINSETQIIAEFIETNRNFPAKKFLQEWFTGTDKQAQYKLNEGFSDSVINIFGSA